MRKNMGITLIAMAVIALMAGSAMGQTWPPAVGSLDFCNGIVGDTPNGNNNMQAILGTIIAAIGPTNSTAVLLATLKCATMDINGPIDTVNNVPTPNGMLDVKYELALVQDAYNDVNYNVNGLTHQMVVDALTTNTTVVKTAIDDGLAAANYTALINSLAPNFTGQISTLLGGFACLGDDDTFGAIMFVAHALAALNVTPPAATDFNRLDCGKYFGPGGDLDGDGCSNRSEYDAANVTASVAAALNPATKPATCVAPTLCGCSVNCSGSEGEGEGEGEGETSGAAYINGPVLCAEGQTIQLRVTVTSAITGTLTYLWSKDGSPLTGDTAPVLTLENISSAANDGTYTCTISNGAKTEWISSPYVLKVLPAGTVPLVALPGLIVLAGACGLAGALGIRRRK
jgi:hypothetical protein